MAIVDHGTVDAILTRALDADEESRAWQDLVRHPGAADQWQRTLLRRQRLDSLAGLISERPWLARHVLSLNRLGRRLRELPRHPLELWPSAALLEATLAPTSRAGDAMVELEWGRVQIYPVRVGTAVELRPRDASAMVQVMGICQAQELAVPSRSWQLETGEAPVLLVAGLGGERAHSLQELFDQCSTIAAVVLVDVLGIPTE